MLREAWFFISITRFVATSTIGYSGIITGTNLKPYNAMPYNSTKYHNIKSWSVPGGSGFYNYSISVDERGIFHLPVEGVYFVGANIILKSTATTLVEVSVRHSLLSDVCYCRSLVHLASKSEKTVMLSCFARFIVETSIVLNLKNSKNIDIVVGSSVSVHYLGMTGNIASFVLPIKKAMVLNGKAIIPVHMDVRDNKYFNAFTDISNLAHIKVPCAGIYLVTLNAIVAVNAKSVFKLYVNKLILLNITHLRDNQTIHFLQSLHLQKDDLITITLNEVTFLPHSTYGLVRLGDVNNVQGVFSPVSGINNDIGSSSGKYSRFSFNFNPTNINRPFYGNSMFISNSVTKVFSRMQFKTQGIYLFSIGLKILSPSEDIELVVFSNGVYDGSPIKPKDGLRTVSKRIKDNNKSTYVTLSGLLRLYDYDEVVILISRTEFFKQVTHVSITKITPYTFASTAIIPMTSQSVLKCENKWKSLSGFEVEKDKSGQDKKYLDLNKYVNVDRFIVPSSGVYLVLAETTVQYAGEPILQHIILALGRETSNGDFKPIIKSHVVTTQKQRMLTIRHIVKLQKDDFLTFRMTCNKSIEFVHKTKLEVIFLSNGEDETYLKASKYNHRPQQDDKKLIIPASGCYFVTMTKLIKYENLNEKSNEVVTYVGPQKGKNDPNSLKIDHLVAREFLDVNDMGSQGQITLQVSGFIRMNKGDIVIVEVGKSNKNENGELLINSISEEFACISLSYPGLSQYSFKTVQNSRLQFTMENREFTIHTFDTISLIYQSPNARFFGSQFMVDKPMLILYDFSMELRGVKGEFRIQLKIRPKPGVTLLSETISVLKKDNIILKAVGVLKLEQKESIEIIIYSKNKEVLTSSHRSWSIIELLPPNCKRHQRELLKASMRIPTRDMSSGGYLQLTYNQSNKLPTNVQLVSDQNIARYATSSFPIISDTFSLTFENNPYMISKQYTTKMEFGVRRSNLDDTCEITFIQLHIPGEVLLNEVSVLLKSVNKTVFYSPQMNKSTILLLCLLSSEVLVMKSGLMTSSSNDVKINATQRTPYINVTFTPVDKPDNLNGFSGTIKSNTTMRVIPGRATRVLKWFSGGLPYFHKAPGLLPVEGVFILKASGYYFISFNIIVQEDFPDGCELLLTGDKMILFSQMITKQTTSLTDVLWLQRNLFIQMQLKCRSQKEEVVFFQKYSTLSLYLIDSQPSFISGCVNSNVVLETNIKNKSLNVAYGRNVELKCFDKASEMGDFIWKRDNKIIHQINGGRQATLKLKNLTTNENGAYHCEMKRGNQMNKINPIEITVIDPRPQLGLSSNSVYIGENYSANKLIAWIKVEAKNVNTNQLAEVKFTIVEGNDEGNFYTNPSVSKSHTSLLFYKPFDFETKKEYKLKIKAENLEHIGTGGTAVTSLVLHIVDDNEHRPKFTKAKSKFKIQENIQKGSRLHTFKALDDDVNYDVRYSCKDPLNRNLFSIDEVSGELIVIGDIDYEEVHEIFLVICAWDTLYKTCIHVQISILNENDNPPYFVQSTYTANITAATAQPGASILALRAADKDSKENDVLKYEIASGNDDGYFTIDNNEIKLLRKYTSNSKLFKIYVNVTDGYYKSVSDALVNIHVLGKDPIPVFSKKVYYANVRENTVNNTNVIQLHVSYDGKRLTSNDDVKMTFSISNLKNIDEKYFKIDEQANIIVRDSIDFERTNTIFLLVTACIRIAGLDRCGICHVTMNVTDINDNRPVFEKSIYSAVLPENHQNETFIIKVKASDKDSVGENSKIAYYLDDEYHLFRINNKTGELYTTRKVDENDGRYFKLYVNARDAGIPQLTSDPSTVLLEMLSTSASLSLPGSKILKNWEFWILPCLVSIVLLLMLAVATIFWKYRRSRRRFQEYVLEQPAMMENKRNSFLTYISKPVSSQEETMYLSCGTLPSAYNSERELSRGDGLNQKIASNIMYSENGYNSFANEPHHSKSKHGTEI